MEPQSVTVPSTGTQEVSIAGLTFLPLTGTIEGIIHMYIYINLYLLPIIDQLALHVICDL